MGMEIVLNSNVTKFFDSSAASVVPHGERDCGYTGSCGKCGILGRFCKWSQTFYWVKCEVREEGRSQAWLQGSWPHLAEGCSSNN